MANFDAVGYVAVNAVPSNKIRRGDVSGDVVVAYDEITFAQNVIAISDVIRTGIKIPVGARVLSCVAKSPSLGTTGIFDVGWAGDTDALLVGADAGGQAVQANGAGVGIGTEVAQDHEVFATFTEATTAANAITVKIWVTYRDV